MEENKITLIKTKDYEEMSQKAGEIIANLIKSKPNAILGLATGSTPIGLYKYLIQKNKEKEISFKDVTTYNLDEYCGIPKNHDQTYYTFMNKNLFDHVDINKENVHLPSGEGNFQENCDSYNKLLSTVKIDLQLLGIGTNGHIGFNKPGTPFDSVVHIVQLTENTIKDNSRFFDNDITKVPKEAITMGIKNILSADTIILVANGKNKAEAIKNLIKGKIDPIVPATALRTHKGKVYVIADAEACSLL